MHQQQSLQSSIESLSKGSLAPSKMIRHLTIVIKMLDKYNGESDSLTVTETFIPCCLFTVPERLIETVSDELIDGVLLDKPEKMAPKLLISLYLKSICKLLLQSSPQIQHIIVESMSKSIFLAVGYPKILKKWIKTLIQLWSTSRENLQIGLRCFLAISKYLGKCCKETSQGQEGDGNMYMWTIRRMYVAYFENCKQVSWRNYEHVNFMINCFCQIVKINTQRAYYVLFGYLRSLALQLDKLHKSKRQQKTQQTSKLFSNQILNTLKLLTSILTRVESETLTALIYPLCQFLAAYQRITESPEYIPLKLHLLELQLTIMDSLGIFVPHVLQSVTKLVRCGTFGRKIVKKSQKVQANIQIAYKVSKNELAQAGLVNQLFRSLITKIYRFETILCRNIYGAEVIMKLHKMLKSHKYIFSQYQQQTQKVASLIKRDSQTSYRLRAQQKLSLSEGMSQQRAKGKKIDKKIMKLQNKLKQTAFEGLEQYQRMKQDEEQLLRDKLAAEQEELARKNGQLQEQEQQQEEQEGEDQDEVNSGWEEASEGASEIDMKEMQNSQDQNEQMEQVSYEGDPEDADEAAKQWSEQEWSSQNDINQKLE